MEREGASLYEISSGVHFHMADGRFSKKGIVIMHNLCPLRNECSTDLHRPTSV